MSTYHYSKKELELIESFGFIDKVDTIDPLQMYDILKDYCFKNDITGKNADSLQRCYRAIGQMHIYRLTPEWDGMINL